MADDKPKSRLARALRLVRYVRTRPYQHMGELARSLGVSRRTLFRDLELLREVDIYIVKNGEEGYTALLPSYLTNSGQNDQAGSSAAKTPGKTPDKTPGKTAIERPLAEQPAKDRWQGGPGQ